MDKKLNQFITNLKKKFALFFSISLGIFLFVLFFQPFWPERFNYNDKLIFVAGLGLIIFIVLVFVREVLPFFLPRKYGRKGERGLLSVFENFLILTLSSVSFAFYIRYVGWIPISFLIMFKVIFVCLVPPVVLRIYDRYKELTQQQDKLRKESHGMLQQVEKYQEDYLNKTIVFTSESNTEKTELLIADIAFIKSADNYVEIMIKEENRFTPKLIRNTLKNVEQQLQPYSFFIRCHRAWIVNTYYILALNRSYNNYSLALNGMDDEIPVSRQYLLKVREVL